MEELLETIEFFVLAATAIFGCALALYMGIVVKRHIAWAFFIMQLFTAIIYSIGLHHALYMSGVISDYPYRYWFRASFWLTSAGIDAILWYWIQEWRRKNKQRRD